MLSLCRTPTHFMCPVQVRRLLSRFISNDSNRFFVIVTNDLWRIKQPLVFIMPKLFTFWVKLVFLWRLLLLFAAPSKFCLRPLPTIGHRQSVSRWIMAGNSFKRFYGAERIFLDYLLLSFNVTAACSYRDPRSVVGHRLFWKLLCIDGFCSSSVWLLVFFGLRDGIGSPSRSFMIPKTPDWSSLKQTYLSQ